MNDFIFKMINATKNKDGSWPGEAHALVSEQDAQSENCHCSKQLQWIDVFV
jgi:hypothetical protein